MEIFQLVLELIWYVFCAINILILGFQLCRVLDTIENKLDQVIEKFNENHSSGEK